MNEPGQMSEPNRDPQDFHTTQWTLVGAAGDPQNPQFNQALEHLLALYGPALRSHLVRRNRLTPEAADDVLQEFVLKKILLYNLVERADRARGKFRTLLLTALDNFTRGSAHESPGLVDLQEIPEPRDARPSPDETFDVPWARQVIDEALRRMQAECVKANRPDVWGVFDGRILGPLLDGNAPAGYQELVDRYVLESPAQASNVLITGKRMFERNLRAVVGEYAQDGQEIDSEIAELRDILSKATG